MAVAGSSAYVAYGANVPPSCAMMWFGAWTFRRVVRAGAVKLDNCKVGQMEGGVVGVGVGAAPAAAARGWAMGVEGVGGKGTNNSSSLGQLPKASSPMLVTEVGIDTAANEVHPLKVAPPM